MRRMEAKFYPAVMALTRAFTVAFAAIVVVGAQQPAAPTNQPPAQPTAPAQGQPQQKPSLPAAASSIAAKPEMFYGQIVTVYSTV